MSSTDLSTALDTLRTASERTSGDATARIDRLAERVENALEDGRTIDHGNLARMDRTLAEIQTDASPEATEAIEAARDALKAYREGVPGA